MNSPQTPEEFQGRYSGDRDDQLSQEDTLLDRGVDDILDEGYSPPEKWQEPRDHESLDERLAETEPDPAMEFGQHEDRSADFPDDGVAGAHRAGRLIAPDDGTNQGDESELWARDVGIDGGAASAEEAAVHIIENEG